MFLQVYNDTNRPLPASNAIWITDTQRNVYHPIVPAPTNLFAYPAAGTREGAAPRSGHRRRARSAPRASCCSSRSRPSRSTTGRSS